MVWRLYPLLFDRAGQAKPAFSKVVETAIVENQRKE
jgi:hypothetical protein